VATTAVGLALVVRINEAYGSVEEEEIQAKDRAAEQPRVVDDETTDRGSDS